MGELHIAADELEVDKVEELLKAHHDANEYDEMGYTPLIKVVIGSFVARMPPLNTVPNPQEKCIQIINLLIKHGADINRPEKESPKRTALHVAAEMKETYLVKHLLECGANANCRTTRGETPLHWVFSGTMRSERKDTYETIKLLLRYGADIEARNNSNCTPLFLASLRRSGEHLFSILNEEIRQETLQQEALEATAIHHRSLVFSELSNTPNNEDGNEERNQITCEPSLDKISQYKYK